ncbi:MAG: exodeoxyribonuclease III [Dehalococcoidales bacterium]|nr:exodeoxyribonuclease III [Dehalococcoidales bacterium]
MNGIKIICWNVNGIRAVARKGFLEWIGKESPDILCLQETKASPEQLTHDLLEPPGYLAYWNYPERKGYSGVATLTKEKPFDVQNSFGAPAFDTEGRVIITKHPGFTICNVYFPNGKQSAERLKYKLDFYEAFLNFLEPLRLKGEKLIICGDVNTAHKEIDLARPKENEKISGFLPIERAWLDKLVANGYIDAFRHFNKEPGQYTWWDMKSRARERNVGWRIDYFFITENLLSQMDKAFIMREVTGSDHCPIALMLH